MRNPFYFTDRAMQVGFIITLDSHHSNHANSKLTINPKYLEFGTENKNINKISKEVVIIYARLINQYNFKYQVVFSARFHKQNEDDEILEETEFFMNLKIDQKLKEADIDEMHITSPLEHQIQQKNMEDSG